MRPGNRSARERGFRQTPGHAPARDDSALKSNPSPSQLFTESVFCSKLESAEQTLKLGFRRAVNPARSLLQPSSVDDCHVTAFARNDATSFKVFHGKRHARPIRRHHHAKKIVGDRQFVAVNTVMRHEEPARDPLFEFAASVGECRVSSLYEEGMRVMQTAPPQSSALRERRAQLRRGDAKSNALHFHDRSLWRPVGIHDDSKSGHAFAPDDGDLDLL
jgi:hypothetical protein